MGSASGVAVAEIGELLVEGEEEAVTLLDEAVDPDPLLFLD